MSPIYKEFGIRLRAARTALGLTQGEVAGRVGLSRVSVTNIEKGRQQVGLHTFIALASAVGVDAASILPPRSDLTKPKEQQRERKALSALKKSERDWVQKVLHTAELRRR